MDFIYEPIYQPDEQRQFFEDLIDDEFKEIFFESNEALYQEWEKQTRLELDQGRKILIAALKPNDYGRKTTLVGACVAYRQSTLRGQDLVAEMVYVRKSFRSTRGQHLGIGTKLVDKAMGICQSYGYMRLVAPARQNNADYIGFLLANKFRFVSRDDYKNIYTFIKNAKESYNGDPYDIRSIVEWLLNKWGISSVEWENDRLAFAQFPIGYPDRFHVELGIEVIKPDPSVLSELKESTYHRLILLDEEPSKENRKEFALLDKKHKNLLILAPGDLKRETSNDNIDVLDPAKIAALVVPIDEAWWDIYKKRVDGPYVYVDGGRYGELLKRPKTAAPDEPYFIVLANSTKNYTEVQGIGMVTEVSIDTPNNIWEKYSTYTSFEEVREFRKYVNVKNILTAIKFENLVVLERSSNLFDLLEKRGWNYMTKERIVDEFSDDLTKYS